MLDTLWSVGALYYSHPLSLFVCSAGRDIRQWTSTTCVLSKVNRNVCEDEISAMGVHSSEKQCVVGTVQGEIVLFSFPEFMKIQSWHSLPTEVVQILALPTGYVVCGGDCKWWSPDTQLTRVITRSTVTCAASHGSYLALSEPDTNTISVYFMTVGVSAVDFYLVATINGMPRHQPVKGCVAVTQNFSVFVWW